MALVQIVGKRASSRESTSYDVRRFEHARTYGMESI